MKTRSAYHTHRGEVPETETEQLSNKRLHPKDGRITARLFSLLFNSVFQSSETAKPDADENTAWMVLLFYERADSFQRKTVVNGRFTTCAGRVFTSLCQDSRKQRR